MATFFGEVLDISSRSAWWSDSDDDGDDVEESKEKPIFSLSIQDQQRFDSKILSQCRRIFLTNVKHFNYGGHVATIKVDHVKGVTGSASTVAWLSPSGNDDQSCWLAINDKLLSSRIHLTVKLVDFLFQNILNRFSGKYDIFIISKDMSRLPYIKYLKSTYKSESLNQWEMEHKPKYPMNLMMAPETSRNEFELAVLEYCIINKMDAVLLILSATVDFEFIPPKILDGINQFGAFQTNLII